MNAPRALGIAGAIVNGVVAIAYPIAVGYGLLYLPARSVSLGMLAVVSVGLAFRLRRAGRAALWSVARLPLAVGSLVVLGAWLNDGRFVQALPVLINAVLLLEFGSTLVPPAVPMIERFARMQHPVLGPAQRRHCRRFTKAWCAFFVGNGAVAGGLALAAPVWWWTVYTGGIAYVLMGLMFVVERAMRPRAEGPVVSEP